MTTPIGRYLEPADFNTGQLTLNGSIIATAHFDENGELNSLYQNIRVPIKLLPGYEGLGPFSYYDADRSKVYLEILVRMSLPGPWVIPTEQDILHRLASRWARWSPVTVEAVNTYVNSTFKREADKRDFINNNCDVNWSKCLHTKLFVPSRLKIVGPVRTVPGVIEYKRTYYLATLGGFKGINTTYINAIEQQNFQNTSRNILRNYSERATNYLPFKTHPDDKSGMFYGIELEYENRTSKNLTQTNELLKHHAIIKRDSSVSGGFEICTAPASFMSHVQEFEKFFEYFKESQLRAERNCGMHVHMSKMPMSFLQLGKIYAFLNNPDNESFLSAVAGRDANTYCRVDTERQNKVSFPFTRPNGDNRYSRVNLQNSDTLEIRMFSSPTTYSDFLMKLEFCKSMFDFSMPGENTIKAADNLDVYMGYLSKNKREYPNLIKTF